MTRQVDFNNDRILSNIFATAIPMLVAQLVHLLYNIVDRIYIGRIPGEGTAALGGIGLCFPVILMITAFTNLFGLGGAPLCSIARGEGNRKKASDIMNCSFFMLVAASLIIFILCELFARPILRMFGASAETMAYALPYLRIYLLGTTASMLATGMNPFITSQGFSSVGMLTVVIGAVANLLLDPLFIFAFHMNVKGAALATILSQLLSALFALRFLRGPEAELHLRLIPVREFKFHLKTARDIISLGTASFIMQFTNSLVQVACNSVLSRFGGDLFISIMTIISSVRQILDTPIFALTDGTSPIIGYNYGARKVPNVKKAIVIMTLISFAYTLIIWILILVRPRMFISIFTSDPVLMEAAVPCMHLYFFTFAFQTLQISGQSVFKSLNKKKQAVFFSLFRKVIMVVPLTYLLPYAFGMGTDGVFIAEPISNVIGGVLCFTTMLLTVIPELNAMEKSKTS